MSIKQFLPSRAMLFPCASFAVGIFSAVGLTVVGIRGFQAMPYIRIFNVLFAVVFVAYFLLKAGFKPRLSQQRFYKAMLALQVLSVVYLLIGLARSNNDLYLVTDFVYLLMFYLTFIVGAAGYKTMREDYTHANFILCVVFWMAFSWLMSMLGVPTPAELLILWGCALVLSIQHRNPLHTVLLILVMLPQTPNLNRALIMGVVGGLIVLFFGSSFPKKLKVLVATALVVGMISWAFNDTTYLQGTGIERRIKESISLIDDSYGKELPLPVQQRLLEAQLVMEGIGSGFQPITVPFGMGHGHTLDMSLSVDPAVTDSQLLGREETHNIHLLNYALLARFGVLGFICFAYLLVFSSLRLFFVLKQPPGDRSSLEALANLYLLVTFLFAATASSFLFSSMLFGYFCGIANQAAMAAKTEGKRRPAPYPATPVEEPAH